VGVDGALTLLTHKAGGAKRVPEGVSPQALTQAQAAFERADAGKKALVATSKDFRLKTVASDGGKTMSGWERPRPDGYEAASPEQIRDYAQQIGHQLTPQGVRDHVNDGGFPGQAMASHAEKQASYLYPGDPLGVSKDMCPDSRGYFTLQAKDRRQFQVVRDPNYFHVFTPDGEHLRFTPEEIAAAS
jgi:hypothetical protein